MTPERREQIEQAIAAADAVGEKWTNASIRARMPWGSTADFKQYMKERRAAAGGVMVDEPDDDLPDDPAPVPPGPTAAALALDRRQLEASYASWHDSLEQIWALERDGPLDEPTFTRARWLEYRMVKNLEQQEKVRAQLETAQLREAVHAAREQHDVHLEEARALAEATLQAVATLHDRLEDLGELFSEMVDAFFKFRTDRGMQAFDVESGFDQVRQLFEAFFPADFRAKDAYVLLMQVPPTIGRLRAALESCPRLKPFSERAIASYLAQQSREEGSTNGSHP
jgi:hypothetical protein